MVARPILLLTAALLLAVQTTAGAQSTARGAVKKVEAAWRDGITPQRMLALEQLARFDDPVCVDALIEILERREVAMYPSARRILGGYAREKTQARILTQGLRHRDPSVRAQVLLALGDGRPTGLDWVGLAEEALDDPTPEVRASAVRALARMRSDGRLDRILELTSDKSERVRMEIPAALVRLAGSRAMSALDGMMRDSRWRVRLAVAQALADVKTPSSVTRLVGMLERERGRLREDLVALLERLTGRVYGADAEAWQQYLAEAPDDFLRTGDRLALAGKPPPRYVGGAYTYYSIGTTSQHFVVVTDLSGSMNAPVTVPGRTGSTSRIELTKTELSRLIESLDSGVWFNLVTFSGKGRLWRTRLSPADDRNKRAALAEVKDYHAEGATDIHGALDKVFDMAEAALDARVASTEDLDTIFLLSDGAPSAGQVRDTSLLLQYVEERNRTLQLRIHCISLTSELESREFMERLAKLGDGHYVELASAP
jgi:HEAT repeat protein/Mg-chelatase subunit ChlD